MSTLLAAMFVLPSCDKGDNPVAYVDFTHLRKYNSKDKEHLPHMWDMLHTTATLQGIVNRTSAEKIYVHHTRCADNRGGWADPAELGLHMAHTAEDWLELVYADLPKNLLVPSAGRYPMLKTLLLKYHELNQQ